MNSLNFKVKLEIKSVTPNGEFEGYASVFNVIDKVNDKIIKGAFEETLSGFREQGFWPPLLWQHDITTPIGEWLEMYEDEHGLFVKGRLFINEIAAAQEAYSLLNKKLVTGLSIGYRAQDFYKDARGVRVLTKVDLQEVSLVTFPANEHARVNLTNNNDNKVPSERELENILRTTGFSRKQAKGIIAVGYKSLDKNYESKKDIDVKYAIDKVEKITKELERFLEVAK